MLHDVTHELRFREVIFTVRADKFRDALGMLWRDLHATHAEELVEFLVIDDAILVIQLHQMEGALQFAIRRQVIVETQGRGTEHLERDRV